MRVALFSLSKCFVVAFAAMFCFVAQSGIESTALAQAESPAGAVPNYWDVSHRVERPDLSEIKKIRFLTEAENPPFSFIGPDGTPTGFLIDLARAVCDELEVPCTLQPMRWDVLRDGLDAGYGDAIISTMAIDRAEPSRFAFTNRFLARPARFVARKGGEAGSEAPARRKVDVVAGAAEEATPEALAGRKVGVVAGTAHEAFLQAFFPKAELVPYPDPNAAREALKSKEVELVFGDGINLSIWLNGSASASCCRFAGGPFTEARYFGDGLAIAVTPDSRTMLRALDFALARVHRSGEYAEIYRRYFPISFY